jgi:hypothetical protein
VTRALLLLALGLASCTSQRARSLPVLDTSEMTLVVEDEGPWREVREVPAPVAVPTEEPPVAPADAPAPVEPTLPVLARRTAEPSPGAKPTKPLALLARERYLDHPTRVRAAQITFRCPASYLPEIRTTASASRPESPTRRVLEGGARLTCRELTLEADVLVLHLREDGLTDVQVSARGDVSFVSDQAGRLFREQGIRSLLLTNDRMVPLR